MAGVCVKHFVGVSMVEATPKARSDLPWWRFWPLLILFAIGGIAYGRLEEKSGTEEAINEFLQEKNEIMQKWYELTCNTADDCREFLRKHAD